MRPIHAVRELTDTHLPARAASIAAMSIFLIAILEEVLVAKT
jgi:hypothetical protein